MRPPPRRKGDAASTPASRELAKQYTAEYCAELLRLSPAGLERMMDIALNRWRRPLPHVPREPIAAK